MKTWKSATGTMALAALIGSSGCADTVTMGSPAYVEGWRMGCYSGYTDAGVTWYWGLANNKPTYGDSPEYEPAWQTGYRSCFDNTLAGVPPWRTLPPSDPDWAEEPESDAS
ncbi:MAG: hypothetical protein GY791_08755 [Alphaproteobacteria bacterium]|nr:hypothetical protein [Alphaproteobacteria bacterium]